MSVKSIEEIMAALKERLGEDTSDETLGFIEDVKDTLEEREKDSKIDWKAKYEENDKTWRQKYRDRFFNGPKPEETEDSSDDEEEPRKKYTYENLFKEMTK